MIALLSPNLGDSLAPTAFACKLAVWESGWVLSRRGEVDQTGAVWAGMEMGTPGLPPGAAKW